MRQELTKPQRQKIADLVKTEFAKSARELGFAPCKAKNLWSQNLPHLTGYIRFRRVSNFSEWPNFQLNFGLTPNLSSDVEEILYDLLRKNTPLHEIWAHHVKSAMEHYGAKSNARYSACNPGTWAFRNLKEIVPKSQKIRLYIQDNFQTYLNTYSSDNVIISYPFGVTSKGMTDNFRVLQLLALGKSGQIPKMKELMKYFENSNKLVAEYAPELIKFYG